MSSQYYLGIAGEQTGPFTEQEIRAKIRSAEVPEDALVWHDAMDDWKPLRQVPELWALFKSSGSGPSKPPPKAKAKPKKAPVLAEEFEAIATFATSDGNLEPAFRSDGKPTKKKKKKGGGVSFSLGGGTRRVALGLALVAILGAAGFFFTADDLFVGDASQAPATPEATDDGGWSVGKIAKLVGLGDVAELFGIPTEEAPTPTPAPDPLQERAKSLKVAQEKMLVSPEDGLTELQRIVDSKNDDAIAKQATDTAVSYLQSLRRYPEAGKLLLKTNRPAEAVEMFLEPPKSYEDADTALMAAAEIAKGKENERRQWLVKSIDLLLEAKADRKKIEERLRLLEKEFAGLDHPYKYYLKTDDEKIADLFNRMSFTFVQSLLAHVATEFPQLTLQERPTVSVVREGNDKYRLVGRYGGAVQLSRDVLPNVKFVFWGHNGVWYLVETDVTEDRRRFAIAEKKRRQSAHYSASELLTYLETLFRNRYPGAALHESIEAAEKHRATASE